MTIDEPESTGMFHPEMTYGSAGVPEPPTTPFSVVKSASPTMTMGPRAVRAALVPEGVSARKARAESTTTRTMPMLARPTREGLRALPDDGVPLLAVSPL